MTKKGDTCTTLEFADEDAARAWIEAARWPMGPICPHCLSVRHYKTRRLGRYRCAAPTCRKDFTVMTGTIMERSHAPLVQWAVAFKLIAAHGRTLSVHELHGALGCQYNTAWFIHHRIMEAIRRGFPDLAIPGLQGNTTSRRFRGAET